MSEKRLMPADDPRFLSRIRQSLRAREIRQVRALMAPLHAADAAEVLEALPEEEALVLFRFLAKEDAATLFSYLSVAQQKQLMAGFRDEERIALIDDLYVDEATDLLEELPANAVRSILDGAPASKRKLLNRYLHYPEDSAGSVMSEEYIRLEPQMTVEASIRKIRSNRKKLASTSMLYVTTPDQKLLGALSIRELLQARDEKTVGEIMTTPVISAYTTDDQEEALSLIRKYGFLALPITDLEARLVGVLTIDDALDIADEEATEDFEIMAALQPSEKPYFASGVMEQAKRRFPWLLVLLVSGMINGLILGGFEDAFTVVPALVPFIPMLTGAGGNAGSQSSTMIIRGLSLGEIRPSQLPRVIWKEFRIACLVGLVLSVVCALRVLVFSPQEPLLAIIVSLSIFCIILLAKLCGGILPILAKRLGMDPALMAAPLITTVVDAFGLIIFFLLAKSILHI